MSRLLLLPALLLVLVAGLAPLALMAARVSPQDLSGLFDARTLSLLGRTLQLGLGATGLALLVGVPFGFLVQRTDVPGAALLRPLGVLPLLIPPLLLAVAWSPLVSLRGAPMTILLIAAGTFPIVALFAGRAFERIDARCEEAALLVGGLGAVLRMEARLVLPPILCGACLAFVFAINDFALPDYVSSVGPKFNVYADEVFATWQIDQADGKAVATALPLVLLTLLALLPALALRRRGAMETISGDWQRPGRHRLGAWRWPAGLACWLLVTVAALVPLGQLLWEAGGAGQGWSSETLRLAFARAIELAGDDVLATLQFAAGAATLAVAAALILGHGAARARGGRALEVLLILPIAVPAILFGIGTLALWSRPATMDFYASRSLVVLMYAGRFLPFAILIVAGAVASLDPDQERAGELAGAGPVRRLLRLVTPNLWPSLVAAWILVFVLSVRELDTAILVPAANEAVMIRVFNAVHFGRADFVAALALIVVFLITLPGLLWSLFAGRRLEVLP